MIFVCSFELAKRLKNQDETYDIPGHEVTIDEIQKETGLDFLSALPENEQKKIETTKPTEQEVNTLLN